MTRQVIALIIFVLALGSVAFAQSNEDFKRLKFISDFVLHGTGLSLSTSDAKIRALGRVNKVDVKRGEADDSKVIAEQRTYYLDGLQIVAHFVKGNDSSGYISETVVTGAKWKIEKGLKVGTSIDTVVKTLGEPTGKSDRTYEYCGETSVDCAIFEFRRNKVVKIKFTYYWD